MKYVVIQVRQDGEAILNVPIVFPDMLVHSMVATQMVALLTLQFFKAGKVTTAEAISAGEFTSLTFAQDGGELCHGKSESIGVVSRGAVDTQLLAGCDYGSPMFVD